VQLSAADYPRLLVVTSNTFNLQTGGGIGLTTFFRNWPRDKIANLHADPRLPDRTVCDHFYLLGEEEIGWMGPIAWARTAVRLARGGSFSTAEAGANAVALGPGPLNTSTANAGEVGRVRRVYDSLVGKLASGGWHQRVALTSHLIAWLDEFRPEVIYATLGDLAFLRLTRLVASRYKLPTIVHILDDWPDSLYRNGLGSFYLRHQMQEELHTTLDRAALRFAICDSMCRAFEKRYGMSFRPLVTPVDAAEWLKHAKNDWSINGTFRLVYMGTVHPLAQVDSLAEVARAVSELGAEGERVRFDIYTPDVFVQLLRDRLGEYRNVSVFDSPPSDEAPAVLSQADLLVIPVNFDHRSFRYIKYSLPAKSIAYMISSTPVLLYGPADVPPIEYASSAKWGMAVTEHCLAALKAAIRKLMADQRLRQNYGLRGREVAIANHDANRVRIWLHGLIRTSASGGSACNQNPAASR
jgi:glycosyltransferase involved in cell wall biosynthesis